MFNWVFKKLDMKLWNVFEQVGIENSGGALTTVVNLLVPQEVRIP
jgi:hypothetical protein